MKKRIEYFDIVRGLCIIYMIAGHIDFRCSEFDHYIHAFHMPIFFILSGIFYKKNSGKRIEYCKKLIRKILVPYFIWAFVFLLIENFTRIGNHTGFIYGLKSILTTNNNFVPIAGALWFLTAFFFSNIIFMFIETTIKNKNIQLFITMLLLVIGIYLYKLGFINLWWSFNASLVGIGLMEIGYLIKEKDWIEKLNIQNQFVLIIVLIVNTFMIMKTDYVNMRTNMYPLIVLFLINMILSLMVYTSMAIRLEKLPKIASCLKLIGKESIIPLCMNQFVILILNRLIDEKVVTMISSKYIIFLRLFILGISLIAITGLTKWLSESKAKVLFGK